MLVNVFDKKNSHTWFWSDGSRYSTDFTMAGYLVALRDVDKSYLQKGMDRIKWSLNKLVEKQKLTQIDADTIYARIVPVVDLRQALLDADLLIEAVPEDMNLKRKVYEEVDKYAESKTVYASNTSTLPITEIGSLTSRPERFVGLHFFNPPQLMQLVEVIPGQITTQSTTDLVISFHPESWQTTYTMQQGRARIHSEQNFYTISPRSCILPRQRRCVND